MADRPLRPENDPAWRDTHALADAHEPELRRAFLAAIAAIVGGTAVTALLRALALNDPTAALEAIPLGGLVSGLARMGTLLQDLATLAAELTLHRSLIRGSETRIGISLTGGLPTETIRQWINEYSATLIQDIATETTRAIRDILTSATLHGQTPRETARLIEAVIGLNRRQAAALARYEGALIGEGITGARLDRLVSRFGARLLRQRARAIARTESITAANAGRRLTWEQNVRDGLIDPSRWARQWLAIVPSDGRTCPDCEELDGQTALIGQPYVSPAYGEVMGPALHPQCRCSEVLVRA